MFSKLFLWKLAACIFSPVLEPEHFWWNVFFLVFVLFCFSNITLSYESLKSKNVTYLWTSVVFTHQRQQRKQLKLYLYAVAKQLVSQKRTISRQKTHNGTLSVRSGLPRLHTSTLLWDHLVREPKVNMQAVAIAKVDEFKYLGMDRTQERWRRQVSGVINEQQT